MRKVRKASCDVGGLVGGEQPVQDQERHLVVAHHAAQEGQQAVEAAALDGLVAAVVEQGGPNRRGIEEGKGAEMGEHVAVRLGEQGDVGRPAPVATWAKQAWFPRSSCPPRARPRRVQVAAEQAAAQQTIQGGDAAGDTTRCCGASRSLIRRSLPFSHVRH